MTTEAEIVKARLGSDQQVWAAATVTTDARAGAASIGEAVMTQDAVHCTMFVVRKSQHQRIATTHKRFAHDQSRAVAHQGQEREKRAHN